MTHKGSEQTKIVPVICRDCKETMTILASASARIVEGRCPGCTEAFNKAGEEYNKRIGFVPTLGAVGIGFSEENEPEELSDLTIHTLACNGAFGLEWLLHGEASDRAVRLLQDGIKFCDYITEMDKSMVIKNSLQKTVTGLQLCVDEEAKGYFKGENAKKMLSAHAPKYSEHDIRMMQQFFNEQGTPYLNRQLAIMRRRQRGKGW